MASKHQKRKLRLSTKVVISVSIFATILTISMYFVLRYWIVPSVESAIKNRVLTYAKVAANLIDGDTLTKILPGKLATTSAEYAKIHEIETKIMAADSQIDDVYTMVATDDPNTVRFVVDGYDTTDTNGDGVISPDEMTAEIGEEYDVTNVSVLKKGFLFPSLSDGYYTDKWGTFLTSAAPIYDSNNIVVGIVGVDVRMSQVLTEERILFIKLGLYMGTFLLIMFGLAIVLSRQVTKRISELNRSILEISSPGATDLLDDTGSDELAELAKSINSLVLGLRQSKEEANKLVTQKTEDLAEKLEELEKLNKLMVGREVVMYDLKKELKDQKNGKKKD